MDGLDKLKPDDRFELLSAYVDNELSANERKQVEAWLESDPEMRRQYQALSSLSRAFQDIPMPQSSMSTDEMLNSVFTKVERRPQILKFAGISAAIIAAIGAVGALLGGPSFSPQMASQKTPEGLSKGSTPVDTVPANIQDVDTDSLMLVLEAPPVDIPIVAENTSFTNSSDL